MQGPSPPLGSVRTQRADSLIRRWLPPGVRIDVLKIDVDMAWRRFGLEGLIVSRAFRVMVIEIDSNWDKAVDGEWQVMAGPRPRARALQGGCTILVAACTT